MPKITIDTDEIVLHANKAGEFVLDQKGEEHLLKLLETQEKLENVLSQVKVNLEKQGLNSNPNFIGARGDKVKVEYRAFGAMYKIGNPKDLKDDTVYTKKVTYSPVAKAIDAYVENNGSLPSGIVANDRKKSISISKIKSKA